MEKTIPIILQELRDTKYICQITISKKKFNQNIS